MATPQSTVEYRDVPGFPGYQVGSDGSVWSHYRPGSYDRNGRRDGIWNKMKFHLCRWGYPKVSLRVDRRRITTEVHRLVLLAFVGPCPEGLLCCHSDGNPTNNRLDNLRWDSPQSNSNDKARHGTVLRGEQQPNAKASDSQVIQIRQRFAAGEKVSVLAKSFGLGWSTVNQMVTGLKWRHLPNPTTEGKP